MKVIGAGLPRTGTNSLQLALSRLLGGDCYHMFELFAHLEHVPTWRRALDGDGPDWRSFFGGYVAAVDWPASAFWRELHVAFPDALVVLSVRKDPEMWWSSFNQTIVTAMREPPSDELREWHELGMALLARFTPDWGDGEAAMAAYQRHNAEVRAGLAGRRLIEWRPEDGWEPICQALELPCPNEPFPRVNSRDEWVTKQDDR